MSSKEELKNKIGKAEKLAVLHDNVVRSIKALADALTMPVNASVQELKTASELLQQAAEFREKALEFREAASRNESYLQELEHEEI